MPVTTKGFLLTITTPGFFHKLYDIKTPYKDKTSESFQVFVKILFTPIHFLIYVN